MEIFRKIVESPSRNEESVKFSEDLVFVNEIPNINNNINDIINIINNNINNNNIVENRKTSLEVIMFKTSNVNRHLSKDFFSSFSQYLNSL